MTLLRGLAFSLLVPTLNMAAITVGAFCTTLAQKGWSADLVAQLTQAARAWFSLGMLILVVLAALLAFGGWCVLRLSAASSGPVGRTAFFSLGVMISALMPALLAVIVLGPGLGLAVALGMTGPAAAIMLREGSQPPRPASRFQTAIISGAAQAGFGRRIR